MFRRPDPEPEDEEPVLRTPPGAAPRNLRTAGFETFGVQAKASFTPPPDKVPANVEPLPRQLEPAAPLEWDFALPEARALEPEASPLLEPDVNRRNVPGQARAVQDIVPSEAKEKFNDNWQRLASEPPLKRRLAKPPSRAWYLTAEGKLDFRALITPAVVLVLAIVTLVVARKVLTPPEPPAIPAAPGK